jgi:hypothetical protein
VKEATWGGMSCCSTDVWEREWLLGVDLQLKAHTTFTVTLNLLLSAH